MHGLPFGFFSLVWISLRGWSGFTPEGAECSGRSCSRPPRLSARSGLRPLPDAPGGSSPPPPAAGSAVYGRRTSPLHACNESRLSRDSIAERRLSVPAAAPEMQALAQDSALLEALRAGDERAFLELVESLHGGMVRFARGFVKTDAAAEDVVQDTWAVVLQDIDRFEGRSALRSWIFGILGNLARTRAAKDGRCVPLSALQPDDGEPAVDASEFHPDSHPRWAGHWAKAPEPWPEARLLSREALAYIRDAIERLPEGQRAVIRLRDVEGWTSQEVCEALGVSEVNQRVLLHRARSRVRREIARHVERRNP